VATSQPQLKTLLEAALAERCFSGCQLYAEHDGGTLSLALGQSSYWSPIVPVAESLYFDIGSITKVVFTTTVLALAVQEKKLSLQDSLGKYEPRLAKTPLGKVTCEQLLNHRSGMVWWYPLHSEKKLERWEEWFVKNVTHLAQGVPDEKAVYSDPGFWALGFFLNAVYPEYGGDFRRMFEERVARVFGLSDVKFGKLPKEICAATEFAEARGGVVHGEVFDENCAAVGGAFPHAGLFATAKGLAPFARDWLRAVRGEKASLNQDVAKRFTEKLGTIADSSWALGWDTKSPERSTAGQYFSPRSFGALGYPGCSLWIDPEQNGFVVFLTNHIHPSRFDDRIREIRPAVHDAVATLWRSK
jgi:serine-type D-Ala-D-Ala carboxypeptidase